MANAGARRKLKGATIIQAHDPGLCGITFDAKGTHILTYGPDAVKIHPVDGGTSETKLVADHSEAVTAVVISPNCDFFASGAEDHAVKIYKYPAARFENNVTRFTLPIRALSFSSTGAFLAAAGDDDGIKLISVVDCSIARVLKGHGAPVLSLAFDPKNDFLASADSDGTVIYWNIATGEQIHILQRVAPEADTSSGMRNTVAWSPDGNFLAVPGRKNNVVLYDRDTGEKMVSLQGGHSAAVTTLGWSPNSLYMATSGLDNKIIIWDVPKKQDFDSQKLEAICCSLSWSPVQNALAIIDVEGRYGIWDNAIPPHMPSPITSVKVGTSAPRAELPQFSDNEADEHDQYELQEPSASEDGDEEEDIPHRRRLKKRRDVKLHDMSDPESEDDDQRITHTKKRQRCLSPEEAPEDAIPLSTSGVPDLARDEQKAKSLDRYEDLGQRIRDLATPLQPPFQPGATEVAECLGTRRRFLCYNLLGSISTREEDGFSHIEVEFHDTSTHPTRVPHILDYYGFTIAALGEKGAVFANPRRGEKSPSTIMYKPFNSWASNSDWSMRLPNDEEVQSVALGNRWVAASTSQQFLRVFSEAGLQRFICSLPGPVVTMASHNKVLAVVTHSGAPMGLNQVIQVTVYNMEEQRKTVGGRLPLSPGATLVWLGFTEGGLLSSYDSQGLLRVYSSEYDGSWVPVFSSNAQQGEDHHWVVGLDDNQLFCVVCKAPEKQPQVSPRPVLSIIKLSVPLLHSDLGAAGLEDELALGTLQLSQTRARADEAAAEGKEDDALEDRILKMEAEVDKCILRLIAAACKADKLVRALELSTLLNLHRSLEGAVRLVNSMRLPTLAERISIVLQEKIELERAERTPPTLPVSAFPGRSTQQRVQEDPGHSFSPHTPQVYADRDVAGVSHMSRLQDGNIAEANEKQNRSGATAHHPNSLASPFSVPKAVEITPPRPPLTSTVNPIQSSSASERGRPSNPFGKPGNPFARGAEKPSGQHQAGTESSKPHNETPNARAGRELPGSTSKRKAGQELLPAKNPFAKAQKA